MSARRREQEEAKIERYFEFKKEVNIIELNRRLDEITEELGKLIQSQMTPGKKVKMSQETQAKVESLQAEMTKLECAINLEYSLFVLDPASEH